MQWVSGFMTESQAGSPAGQLIAKTGWNYWLIHGDGSEGVHNPSFTFDVIDAAPAALEAGVAEE
jgi:hypothetical protein